MSVIFEACRHTRRSDARRRCLRRLTRLAAGCVLAVQTAFAHAPTAPAAPAGAATHGPTQSGSDPTRGKALVESSRCLDCHRIAETGSRVGPDLSEIGKLRSSEQLERALVAPDAEVLPENRFVRVVTKEGITATGRLLNQDAFSIQLMDKDEQLKSYLKSNLREHTIIVKSMMPSYEGKLTAQQIADIVSYLEALKGAEK